MTQIREENRAGTTPIARTKFTQCRNIARFYTGTRSEKQLRAKKEVERLQTDRSWRRTFRGRNISDMKRIPEAPLGNPQRRENRTRLKVIPKLRQSVILAKKIA